MASKKETGSVFRPFSVGGVVCACFAIITLAMCYLCIKYTDYRPDRIVLLSLAIYLGIVAFVITINFIVAAVSRKGIYSYATAVTQGISAKFVQKLSKPVVICDEKGKIVWYNQYFRDVCGGKTMLYNKYIDSVCDATLERIIKNSDLMGTDVHFTTGDSTDKITEGVFNAVGYELEYDGKKYGMATFTDVTALKILERRIRDEDTYIGYAMIDNLEELLQYIQELYSYIF